MHTLTHRMFRSLFSMHTQTQLLANWPQYKKNGTLAHTYKHSISNYVYSLLWIFVEGLHNWVQFSVIHTDYVSLLSRSCYSSSSPWT